MYLSNLNYQEIVQPLKTIHLLYLVSLSNDNYNKTPTISKFKQVVHDYFCNKLISNYIQLFHSELEIDIVLTTAGTLYPGDEASSCSLVFQVFLSILHQV